jgi:DNA-directed RNA polymerase subunit RPC12/RpoP
LLKTLLKQKPAANPVYLRNPELYSLWFCLTCGKTTVHKRVKVSPKKKTLECTRCHNRFEVGNYWPKGTRRILRRKNAPTYQMLCLHCYHKWTTKALKKPRHCHWCGSPRIVVVGVK